MSTQSYGTLFTALSLAIAFCSGIPSIPEAEGAPDKTAPHFNTSASTESSGLKGQKTASGQRFNPQSMTAASRTLPLGSRAKVTNRRTGAHTMVTINDRGPYGTKGRDLDLSRAAADKVGSTGGHVRVHVEPSKFNRH